MIRAVIFDLDGTLLDTEKYYRETWPKALAKFGYVPDYEIALELRSLGRPFAPALFRERFGEDFDYYAVREERTRLVEECVRERGVQIKPGAETLLSYLHEAGIIAAIATASPLERTKRYMDLAGLPMSRFDRIVSATEVKNGKPAPDVYLRACEELGLSPAECMAVEDAPNGIRSAYRAGLFVCMVPDQTGPDPELLPMLSASVETLADLIPVISEMNLK